MKLLHLPHLKTNGLAFRKRDTKDSGLHNTTNLRKLIVHFIQKCKDEESEKSDDEEMSDGGGSDFTDSDKEAVLTKRFDKVQAKTQASSIKQPLTYTRHLAMEGDSSSSEEEEQKLKTKNFLSNTLSMIKSDKKKEKKIDIGFDLDKLFAKKKA